MTLSLPVSILPIQSKPYGLVYGEWSVRWWQWFLSIPKSNSPAFDDDGSNVGIRQQYLPVLFLCQTYENSGVQPIRTISMPKNYSIFMPIINWISLLEHDAKTDQELLAVAKERMNVVRNLEFRVNGLQVTELMEYRVLSPLFDVELPQNNIMSLSPGIRRAISDGFWLFLKPQSESIEISSFGSCSSGQTRIGVTYKINLI